MSNQSVRIEGELFWAKWMETPNTKFNPDNTKYECTIGNLSDADAKKLESLGVKIKQKDSMGKYIVGKSQFVFKPIDAKGNEVSIESIGNGTKIVADISSYTHRMSSVHGNAPSIRKLVVKELKVYNPEPELADDIL